MTVNARTEPAPVLVGLKDGQEHVALSWAAEEAAQRQAPLRILHAFMNETYFPWGYGYTVPTGLYDIEERFRANALSLLADAVERVRLEHPDLPVTTTVARATAAGSIVAASDNASLVVLSRRRHQHPRAASLGSVPLAVAAHASCPVVVVPELEDDGSGPRVQAAARPGPIAGQVVVGVEDSRKCLDAVGFAFAHASAHGLAVTAVHGWWLDPKIAALAEMPDWAELGEDDPTVVDAILAPWRVRYPEVKVSRIVVRQRPAEALVEAGAGARLLVVGSRGHGGFTGLLLGSVSRYVLQHAACPVAVVRAGQLPTADDLDVTAAR